MENNWLDDLSPAAREQFMRDVYKEAKRRQQADEANRYQTESGIVQFCQDVLGADLYEYQVEILKALVRTRRVAVRGPHGLGKTTLAAFAALWAVLAHNGVSVKVVTTAPTHYQVASIMWPEIRRWARKAKASGFGPAQDMQIQQTRLKFEGLDKQAEGRSSDDPVRLEGVHADVVLYILDEARGIPDAFLAGILGAMASGDAYLLVISTPGAKSGFFYDAHSGTHPGYRDWASIHVTIEQAVKGNVRQRWVDEMAALYGEGTPIYQTRVLGEFASSDEQAVIPLAWIEQAVDRWRSINGKGSGELVLGVDPAVSEAGDMAVAARLRGGVLVDLHRDRGLNPIQLAAKLTTLVESKDTPVAVDSGGGGGGPGVVAALQHGGFNVTPIGAGESADDTDHTGLIKFVNRRAQLAWQIRDALNPQWPYNLAIPDDPKLIGDLSALRYDYDAQGRVRLESKDEIRKRLGRSPDDYDALALAWHVSPYRKALKPGSADGWQLFVPYSYGDETEGGRLERQHTEKRLAKWRDDRDSRESPGLW